MAPCSPNSEQALGARSTEAAMTSFDELLTAARVDDSTDTLTIPTGFSQGKATFGGLVVGVCVRSMEARVTPDGRRLRSISSQLLGAPVPGPATIRVRLLRASNTVTTFAADLEQGGQVMTHVVGVFGKARATDLGWQRLPAPSLPAWSDVEALDLDLSFAPEFTQHFEYRNTGAVPYSGSGSDASAGFFRPRVRCAVRDGAWLACMADVWWLASATSMNEFRAGATLTLNADFHHPVEGLDPEAPLFHRGSSHVLHEGYASETRELWGVDGRLLVSATELIAIIK